MAASGRALPAQAALDRLAAAVAALADERPADALAILGPDTRGLPEPGDLERSVRLACDALLAEQAGDLERAVEGFETVDAVGVGLAPLLRVSAAFWLRRFDHGRALDSLGPLLGRDPGEAELARDAVRHAPLPLARLLEGDHPRFGGLALHKERVRTRLGSLETAVLLASGSPGERPRRAMRMPREGLLAHCRRVGTQTCLLQAGRAMELPAPVVHGREPGSPLAVRTRDVLTSVLADVVVSSHSNVLISSGCAVLDINPEEWHAMEPWLDMDPVIAGDDGTDVLALVDDGPIPVLEAATSLAGVSSAAFGHWLLEFLPRLWPLLEQPGFSEVAVIIDEQMPPQHVEAVRALVGPDHPLVILEPGASVRVRQLWAATMPCYMPLGPSPGVPVPPALATLDPAYVAGLLRSLRHDDPEPRSRPTGHGGVYLTRRGHPRRRLVNEEDVERFLEDRGFLIVEPAALPFAEQVRLVREADTLIAADGSANFLTFLARPGTRIGVLTHTFVEDWEWYAALCAALDQPFRLLTGALVRLDTGYKWFSDYRIDLRDLEAMLDAF